MHQGCDHVLKDHAVGNTRTMTPEGVRRRDDGVLRQERRELDPDWLQQACWQDRHGVLLDGSWLAPLLSPDSVPVRYFRLPIAARSKFWGRLLLPQNPEPSPDYSRAPGVNAGGAGEQEPESAAGMVRAEMDADAGDGEASRFSDPAADLDDAQAERIELEARGVG